MVSKTSKTDGTTVATPERVSFKRVVAPQRIVEIGEYEFDVSKVPARISIRVADMLLLFGAISNESLVDLTVETLQLVRPDLNTITKEWLLSPDVSDATSILDIVQYVTKPAIDQFKKKTGESGDDPNSQASQN